MAFEIAKRLSASGHDVQVVTYSEKSQYQSDTKYQFNLERVTRSKNKILNYFRYYFAIKKHIPGKDIVYTLDWFSAGVPVMIAAKLAHKRYCVRVGGGYIWEKYLAQGNPPMPLREFYEKGLHKKYRIMFWFIKKVLQKANLVIFNSQIQKDLYENVYGIDSEKSVVIENAVPENKVSNLVQDYNERSFDRDKEIVFAGRLIKMKNVDTLIKAFAKMADKDFRLLIIGDGPEENNLKNLVNQEGINGRVEFHLAMTQSDLYYRIARSYLVVIPSWTDISPNQAYECLGLGIPFLISKENFLPIREDLQIMFDPHSVSELTAILDQLGDRPHYENYLSSLRKIKYRHSWDAVVDEHLRVFNKLGRLHDNT